MEKLRDHSGETSAPFNMGIATLQRLDNILIEIKMTSANSYSDPIGCQSIKIDLVKQFFLNAVPLLKSEVVKKYKTKVLSLSSKVKEFHKEDRWKGIKKVYLKVFDPEIDKQLNEILLDLQTELQLERYFMPSKADPRHMWGEK